MGVTPSLRSFVPAGALIAALILAGSPNAQCGPQVSTRTTIPDTDGSVEAMCWWDPDGAGPQPPVAVLGGSFRSAGNAIARGLALYDPATRQFSTLGSGIGSSGGTVFAITVTPQNELIVAGSFASIDGVPANNVARWDGSAWHRMGTSGIPHPVRALLVRQNGDLIAGVSGSQNGSVLRWNGVAWQAFGAELVGGVLALHESPTGELFAGGSMLTGPTDTLARWDGLHWTSVAGAPIGFVSALLRRNNGDLIVAGGFLQAGGVATNHIASWDGSTWSPLGSGVSQAVIAVAERSNGELIVGGLLTAAGGVPANLVASWNGTQWSTMDNGLGVPGQTLLRPVASLLALPGGDVLAGGEFRSDGDDMDHLARWDGSSWQQARPGTGGAVWSSATGPNGDLYVAGEFTQFEGVAARRVARRSSGTWLPLGNGADDDAYAVAVLPNGDVVLGGAFSSVDGVSASRVARWDGTAWHAMGSGLPGKVRSLAVTPDGQLLASGDFVESVAAWDGSGWSGTGVAFSGSGSPSFANYNRLWQPTPEVILFRKMPAPFVRWNGSGWQELDDSDPYRTALNAIPQTLIRLPDGDLLGGFPAPHGLAGPLIRRWNGSAWTSVFAPEFGAVRDLKWSGDGRVLAAGKSSVAGVAADDQAGFLRELTTTCGATADPIGTGCAGSGGPNVLTALERAWVGGTLQSRATGMPTVGVAIEIYGLGTLSQPLAGVLPQAGVACTLLATPDFLRLQLADQGVVDLALTLPNDPSLVGVTFRQQVAAVELDAAGVFVDATSSNALQFTIGSW